MLVNNLRSSGRRIVLGSLLLTLALGALHRTLNALGDRLASLADRLGSFVGGVLGSFHVDFSCGRVGDCVVVCGFE